MSSDCEAARRRYRLYLELYPKLISILRQRRAVRLVFSSSPTREAELRLLTDKDVKEFTGTEGIVLTTWRELKKRRDLAQN